MPVLRGSKSPVEPVGPLLPLLQTVQGQAVRQGRLFTDGIAQPQQWPQIRGIPCRETAVRAGPRAAGFPSATAAWSPHTVPAIADAPATGPNAACRPLLARLRHPPWCRLPSGPATPRRERKKILQRISRAVSGKGCPSGSRRARTISCNCTRVARSSRPAFSRRIMHVLLFRVQTSRGMWLSQAGCPAACITMLPDPPANSCSPYAATNTGIKYFFPYGRPAMERFSPRNKR